MGTESAYRRDEIQRRLRRLIQLQGGTASVASPKREADPSIPQRTAQRWSYEVALPTVSRLPAVAAALGVPAHFIVTGRWNALTTPPEVEALAAEREAAGTPTVIARPGAAIRFLGGPRCAASIVRCSPRTLEKWSHRMPKLITLAAFCEGTNLSADWLSGGEVPRQLCWLPPIEDWRVVELPARKSSRRSRGRPWWRGSQMPFGGGWDGEA